MLVRIGLETRQHHADADADRLAVMEAADENDYRDFLARIYGLEAAIENEIEQLSAQDRLILDTHNKQDRLHADLLALGMSDLDVLKLKRCAVRIRSGMHAHGWMFVIERQSLLAGLVSRHLAHAMPDVMQRAGSYFMHAAERSGARFRHFGDALGEQAKRYGALAPSTIVSAANDAFRAQRLWYAGSSLHTRLRGLLDDPSRRPRPPTLPPLPAPSEARAPTHDAPAARDDLQPTR
jgi:heme oxygenase